MKILWDPIGTGFEAKERDGIVFFRALGAEHWACLSAEHSKVSLRVFEYLGA